MPEMDGETLAERLQEVKAAKNLPLVMLTSLGAKPKGHSTKYFEAYLAKPVKPSLLFNTLLQLFPTKKNRTESVRESVNSAFQLPKIRVLVADDNNSNQRVAQLSLERLGLRAETVADGNEVLQALIRYPYDVILMDVHMPEVNGLEATRRIRSRPPTSPQPYIIAVTANATVQDRKRCLDSGMDDYISKPYRLRDLKRALQRYATRDTSTGRLDNEFDSVTISQSSQPVFDTSALTRLAEMLGTQDRRKVEAFIDKCLPELASLLARTKAAAEKNSMNELVRALHSLKGNARVLGANRLAERVLNVESSMDDGGLDVAASRIRELETAHEHFLGTLAKVREEWTD